MPSIPPVGQKFNSGWSFLPGPPFQTSSLWQEVEAGDDRERREVPWQSRTPVKACPLLLAEALRHLVRRHENLTTLTAVTRYTGRCGVRGLSTVRTFQALREARREKFLAMDEVGLLRFAGHTYAVGHEMGAARTYLNAYSFIWVHAKIADLADVAGLPLGLMTLVTLAAGLAQDDDEHPFLPDGYVAIFREEVQRFLSWLENRATAL